MVRKGKMESLNRLIGFRKDRLYYQNQMLRHLSRKLQGEFLSELGEKPFNQRLLQSVYDVIIAYSKVNRATNEMLIREIEMRFRAFCSLKAS
ncbi:hypothetical protein PAESOLCIP111_04745 [Paenibacillus solanacearum]|uniref:Uncharacterized protein n=3 Tax=Paenibacillus TaxID=44249 RepID=A0A916K4U9_9BACL|nr:hypothetical protein PAESOLCIP111_04745 [Paenibacillus solanacearum]CAG7645519.1 hypothetical protein PAECIP111802_03536 [Paenibacillus allorhizosphaerae]